MRNHQELRTNKTKDCQHKKIKKIEVLNKYRSLFHKRNDPQHYIKHLNQQTFLTSFNHKDLPKTLQAYYSVNNGNKLDNNSSFGSILHQMSEDKQKKRSFSTAENSNDRKNSRSRSKISSKDSSVNFTATYVNNPEISMSTQGFSEEI